MPDRVVPPPDIAPHVFFTVWVPERVAGDPERRRKLGATEAVLEFEIGAVDGEEGGVFGLHVREGLVAGTAGRLGVSDLRIRLDIVTWRELNAGTLTAPEAFLRRRISLEGDLRLAVKLHLIIG
jgi:putative sterol carrier protein